MKACQLDDKAMDEDFLNGKPVKCRAVLPANPVPDDEMPKAGDAILVLLSTGKKYKGWINGFEAFSIDHYTLGELEITRSR